METSSGTVRTAIREIRLTAVPLRDRLSRSSWVAIALWILAACAPLWVPGSGWAEVDGAAPESGRQASPTISAVPPKADNERPKIELGRLLKLPDSYRPPSANRRGVDRSKWEKRFEGVRLELSTAVQALATAQTELGEAADESSAWAVAAPGGIPNPENTPLSYKLRQEIRRQRELVERAERLLLALEIEADLADVPDQWRAVEGGVRPSS